MMGHYRLFLLLLLGLGLVSGFVVDRRLIALAYSHPHSYSAFATAPACDNVDRREYGILEVAENSSQPAHFFDKRIKISIRSQSK
jgi:hypothetical protein